MISRPQSLKRNKLVLHIFDCWLSHSGEIISTKLGNKSVLRNFDNRNVKIFTTASRQHVIWMGRHLTKTSTQNFYNWTLIVIGINSKQLTERVYGPM